MVSASTWISHIPQRPVRSSVALGWEQISAYRFNDLRCTSFTLPPSDWHFVAAHLMRPCTVCSKWNGRLLKGKSLPGNTMLMSAGQESTWACSNSMDELLIFLDPDVVKEVAEEVGVSRIWLLDGLGLVNPGLQVVASQILAELEMPEVATRLFADTLARTLALHLVRRHSTARPIEARVQHLSPRQLRAATDLIDSSLDQDLSLKSIANAAAISPFRFARGFREALGQSPRQYIISRRIERAKELLKSTDQTLADIGSQVGFATQSHFTAMFRRRCGTTPKRYRETVKN